MNAAALLAVLAMSAPATHDSRPTQTCPAQVVAAFDELDDTLRHLDEQVARMGGKPKKREHLREDVADALQAAQAARVEACRAHRQPPVVVVEPPPPPRPTILILDEPAHRSLVSAVRKEAWDDGRLRVLELGTTGVCVTSAQARDYVSQMTFSRGKIDVIRMLAARIVDRQLSYTLLDGLTFDTDKRVARDVLSSASPVLDCVAGTFAGPFDPRG